MVLRAHELLTHPDYVDNIETCNWRTPDSDFEDRKEGAHLTLEEVCEMGQTIIKYYDRRKDSALDKLCEETVDSLLMIDQMVRQLPPELLHKWMKIKLERTIERYHTPGTAYDDTAQY